MFSQPAPALLDAWRDTAVAAGWKFRRGLGNPRVRVAEQRGGSLKCYGETEQELLRLVSVKSKKESPMTRPPL